MTREQALAKAVDAVARAARLADHAEQAAHGTHYEKAQQLAAAGALWADVARSYAALAQALPVPLPSDDARLINGASGSGKTTAPDGAAS